jgi:hypothetical protein
MDSKVDCRDSPGEDRRAAKEIGGALTVWRVHDLLARNRKPQAEKPALAEAA